MLHLGTSGPLGEPADVSESPHRRLVQLVRQSERSTPFEDVHRASELFHRPIQE